MRRLANRGARWHLRRSGVGGARALAFGWAIVVMGAGFGPVCQSDEVAAMEGRLRGGCVDVALNFRLSNEGSPSTCG